jgi:hypothetical protein
VVSAFFLSMSLGVSEVRLGSSPDLCFRVGMSAYAKCGHCPAGLFSRFAATWMPAAPPENNRGLWAVHRGPPAEWDRPSVRAPGGLGHAAREPRSAILTPSTACGRADGDRWTVSPRAIAASMSASSTWLSSSISRPSAAIRAAALRSDKDAYAPLRQIRTSQ